MSGTENKMNTENQPAGLAESPRFRLGPMDWIVSISFIVVMCSACIFLLLAALATDLAVSDFASGDVTPAALLQGQNSAISAASARNGWKIANLVRGAEVFATLAALLLVFHIVRMRSHDALMSFVGLVVIAALIVPTADIVRLVDLARGNVEGTPDIGSKLGIFPIATPEASVLVAQRVVFELGAEGLLSGTEPPTDRGIPTPPRHNWDVRKMDQLKQALGVALYRVEVGNIATAIKQRQLDRMLLELTLDTSRQNLLMNHSRGKQIREDLYFLRDIGVITQLYDQTVQTKVTPLGYRVLHRLFPEEQRVRDVARDAGVVELYPPSGQLVPQARQFAASVPLPSPRVIDPRLIRSSPTLEINSSFSGLVRQFSSAPTRSPDGKGIRLIVRESKEIVIEARAIEGDPELTLWSLTSSGGEERAERQISYSDDWGVNSNDSRILWQATPGNYFLQINSAINEPLSSRISIRIANERDRVAGAWDDISVESLNPFDRVEVDPWSDQKKSFVLEPGHEKYFLIRINQAGGYRIVAKGEPGPRRGNGPPIGDGIDPTLILGKEVNGRLTDLKLADDSGETVRGRALQLRRQDALIEAQLSPGNYWLIVGQLAPRSGTIELEVIRDGSQR